MLKMLKLMALPAVALTFALANPANAFCGSCGTTTLVQPAVLPSCNTCGTLEQSAVVLPETTAVQTFPAVVNSCNTFGNAAINPGLIDNNLYSAPSTMTYPSIIDNNLYAPSVLTYPSVIW